MYCDGEGVPRDLKEAARLTRKASCAVIGFVMWRWGVSWEDWRLALGVPLLFRSIVSSDSSFFAQGLGASSRQTAASTCPSFVHGFEISPSTASSKRLFFVHGSEVSPSAPACCVWVRVHGEGTSPVVHVEGFSAHGLSTAGRFGAAFAGVAIAAARPTSAPCLPPTSAPRAPATATPEKCARVPFVTFPWRLCCTWLTNSTSLAAAT
jgi:hypothetical protein